MISIDNTLVSIDVVKVQFMCNLQACHGSCCVEGDEGAPLEEEEIGIIEDYLEEIEPYMRPEGIEVVERYGVFDYGIDGEYVTPLVNNQECAFVFFENEIAYCAIERAYREGKIDFVKPISCHLYPIRINKFDGFEAVNYHQWPICSPALKHGKQLGIPVYKMLKEPLIRKYGENWYARLESDLASGMYDELLAD
jgi:hypothetical protein